MPRLTNRLSAQTVRSAKPGRHPDGGGLALIVVAPGRAYWQFRWERAGKGREMSLGPLDRVSLTEARALATDARRLLEGGGDPLVARKAATAPATPAPSATTFRAAALTYIEQHAPSWRSAVHAKQWSNTLATYAFPVLGDIACAAITTPDVLRVLQPHWQTKTETMVRVRGRIETVLDFARVRGWVPDSAPNVAVWKGRLAHALPAKAKVAPVEHHAALPWRDMPAFWTSLAQREGMGTLALQFCILTAARSGSVRQATWSEVKGDLWAVPGAHMKGGVEWRCPVSEAAKRVLDAAAALSDDRRPEALIFPGHDPTRQLSDMSLTAVLRRMGRGDLTCHGFRSSFRDWVSEATDYAGEAAEMQLAHAIGNAVEAAYRRGDLFSKRQAMISDWATFCAGAKPAD